MEMGQWQSGGDQFKQCPGFDSAGLWASPKKMYLWKPPDVSKVRLVSNAAQLRLIFSFYIRTKSKQIKKIEFHKKI